MTDPEVTGGVAAYDQTQAEMLEAVKDPGTRAAFVTWIDATGGGHTRAFVADREEDEAGLSRFLFTQSAASARRLLGLLS